jgi:hypothetical protein
MATRNERIDDLVAENPGWQGETVATLRRLIHEADPEITEEWKWVTANRPGTPVWEHGGIVCHINVLKGRVRLTLQEGASLPDPVGLYNASLEGNQRRAIDIYEGDAVNETAIRDLVRAAVNQNLAKARPADRSRGTKDSRGRK